MVRVTDPVQMRTFRNNKRVDLRRFVAMPSSYTLDRRHEYGSRDKWSYRRQYTTDPVDEARGRTSRSSDPVSSYHNVTIRLPRPPRLSFDTERDESQHDR